MSLMILVTGPVFCFRPCRQPNSTCHGEVLPLPGGVPHSPLFIYLLILGPLYVGLLFRLCNEKKRFNNPQSLLFCMKRLDSISAGMTSELHERASEFQQSFFSFSIVRMHHNPVGFFISSSPFPLPPVSKHIAALFLEPHNFKARLMQAPLPSPLLSPVQFTASQ